MNVLGPPSYKRLFWITFAGLMWALAVIHYQGYVVGMQYNVIRWLLVTNRSQLNCP